MPVKDFTFEIGTGQFVPALQQMLQYVGEQIAGAGQEQVLFAAKVILTELLTNAIKHAHTAIAIFRIEIDNSYITFTKTDTGTPMPLLQHPQLHKLGDSLCLMNDQLHNLQATLVSHQSLRFTCIEHDLTELPNIDRLEEHFGLLMMAKTADECGYRYDERRRENVFRVKKWL